MIHSLRRPMMLVTALLLLLSSVTSAFADDSQAPDFDSLGSDFAATMRSGVLKHPKLDSTLAELANDVEIGTLTDGAIARKGRVSQGSTVAVTIFVEGDPNPLATWLGSRGERVIGIGSETVEAYVQVSTLESLAAQPGVTAVRSIDGPTAKVVSQGVGLHNSPHWNSNGYTGAGVKVGVIDVGFRGILNLVGNELPTPIGRCYRSGNAPTSNLSDCAISDVHGSAVAETLIDVAPDATLYVSNPGTWLQMRDAVNWMASQGVTIINFSAAWMWTGPGDGTSIYSDGPLATVDLAVASGITWVNAAGNEGSSTWSGGYRDNDSDQFLDFVSGIEVNAINVFAGQNVRVQMRWDDTWGFADTDLDLMLYDSGGTPVAVSQEEQSGQSGDVPLEVLDYTASSTGTVYVSIMHYDGPAPTWIQIQEFNGYALEHSSASGSIGNPAESANNGMLAVGAASWTTPNIIEKFSSQGPTRDGRIKPDVVGIDYADTVSYGPSSFPGTSQASPHVAGLAALVKQRFPEYGPVDVAHYLRSNATQSHAPNNTWGYGLAYLPEIVGGENPIPRVISVSPASIPVGASPMNVTVSGSGFVEGSIVRWNGQDRETTFVNSSTLTFSITSIDVESPTNVQITVSTPQPGGGISAALTLVITDNQQAAVDYAEFERTWQRTDEPVRQIVVSRTWMWGPGPASDALLEEYEDAPGGQRSVKYYEKSRMEVTDPDEDSSQVWYVTNGLLSKELITGEMQLGDDLFDDVGAADVPVAGDPDDAEGPTYATFTDLLDDAPYADGATIIQRVDRNGTVTTDDSLAQYGVTAASLVDVPGIQHQVASPFWEFMTSSGIVYEDGLFNIDQLFENPFYATGLPITEAYWARVKVAGEYRDVLMQCFERRCLTYTPGNPEGWKVEAANVGLHYYTWRYENPSPAPDCDPAYPDFCIPSPPPDLDCDDAPIAGQTGFTVLAPDPHGLDTDGDGIGCEVDPPSEEVPPDQEALYTWNINNWEPHQGDHTTITPIGNDLHFQTDTDTPLFAWRNVPTGDYSVSVDVRLVDAGDSVDSTACVVARLAEDYSSDYALCVNPDGSVDVLYETYGDAGYNAEFLIESDAAEFLNPVSEWNTLKIVVVADELWFLVNGELIGAVNHDGSDAGLPAMYVLSFDENVVEYAFTNFNVYGLE